MRSKVLFTVATLLVTSAPGLGDTSAQHHAMVMSHGAQVMPFDQNVAMHMFTPSAMGGTLEIMVHNMDPKQISLVRAHLRTEAARFAIGDYSDPAYIHSKTMPGLPGMEATAVAVRYLETQMGARIVFIGSNTAAIDSIHRWLAAQAADHSSSASDAKRRMCHMKSQPVRQLQ